MNDLMIVAELSANHCGDYAKAEQLVKHAAVHGADAIKLQTFLPCEMTPPGVLIESGPWAGRTYAELYSECRTPIEWHPDLFKLAKELGMVAFSAPFSVDAVRFLEEIDCPIYKIASPEIIHYPLIKAAAATGKPLIISTGMASRWEIREALKVAVAAGASRHSITLLHCLSAYPASTADFNMNTLDALRAEYSCKVGLSDHSRGHTAAMVAVAKGATVIEKHLCLSHNLRSPDVAFSADPFEFRTMAHECRKVHEMLGEPVFGVRNAEETSQQYRRSLWTTRTVKAGEAFTMDNVAVLRPNHGLHPVDLPRVLKSKAAHDIPIDTPLTDDDISGC